MKYSYFFKRYQVLTKLILLILGCLGLSSPMWAQSIAVAGANMESSTGWTIYNMGSANPASYQFNYTADVPVKGKGGCLRVTSSKKTNILFWQKVKLKAGKRYVVDCAAKTNYVQDFWLEMFLCPTAPVANQDYNPTSNLVLGLSTWVGCGPYLDGQMSVIACNGYRSFTPTGTYNTDVDIYFGIKTGIYNDMTTQMEVLIDEVSITEVDDSKLISTVEGTLDQTNLKITGVTPSQKTSQLRAGLHAWPNASINILGKVGNKALRITQMDSVMISDTLKVKVTGATQTSYYNIELRPLSNADSIISTSLGALDTVNYKLVNIPGNVKAAQLKSALVISDKATIKIIDTTGVEVSAGTLINARDSVQVIAENGARRSYAIELGNSLTVESRTNYKAWVSAIQNRILELSGKSELHISSASDPFKGSSINLKSQDVWIYLDSIKPQVVNDKYLSQILVNGKAASVDVNIRVTQYYQGTVIISQPSSYGPLNIYPSDNLGGYYMTLGLYTYYRSADLGVMNNNICSFTLKKGYMATFANDDLGTGYSKVYIAVDSDLVIKRLPDALYKQVSFVRVVPWRWVTKKGWCGGSDQATDILNCSWRYDWDNVANSTLNFEYVPMRHNRNWNSYDNINNKKNTTAALGFNEPDRTDQANMSVSEAISLWPELLKSGLRLGSPCPSDGGLNWLFSFIHTCDSLNYRVDFVAMHFYLGGQSAKSFYDRLKWIHDVTNRPIWITEWNNGANWTDAANGKPTYESEARTISQFIQMLDTTSFVERYSIYEWVEDTRQMFYSGPPVLTPAGEVYRDKVSPKAYNQGLFSALFPSPANGAVSIKQDTLLSWTNGNFDVPGTIYKIHFGTTANPPLVAKQGNSSFNPGHLEANTTYYWRIDEVTDCGTKTGTQWSFTTANPSAVEVIPSGNNGKSIRVFPVPAIDELHIDGLVKEEPVEIYNLLGEKVFQGRAYQSVNVQNFRSGIYILAVKGNYIRFIKQ